MDTETNTRLEGYCNYIISEYLKAGGKLSDVSREATYYALLGIYEREGIKGVEKMVKEWEPRIKKARPIGYGG